MGLTMPANSGGNYEMVPEGNHLAVCVSVIDKGTQVMTYPGKAEMHQRQVYLSWEIAEVKRSDGKPFYIGTSYTLSSNEKANLRKALESWRGQKFTEEELGNWELKNILGKGCMLNVVHAENGDKTYANIATIAQLPTVNGKRLPAPTPTGELVYLSLEPDDFDAAAFESLGDKMKEAIRKSPEFAAVENLMMQSASGVRSTNYVDDDIPF
jgi:hypothetical protein